MRAIVRLAVRVWPCRSARWWAARRWTMGAVLLLCGPVATASGETAWPAGMSGFTRGLSESDVPAVLPEPVRIEAPGSDVSRERRAFSGIWHGWACRVALCDIKVAIERIEGDQATVAYAGAARGQGLTTDRVQGRFVGPELHAVLKTGSRLVLRPRGDGDLDMGLWRDGAQPFSVGVLTQQVLPYERRVERVPTPWEYQGRPVQLEMVVVRPVGPGPFPTMVFNHGSTGNGDRPDWFSATATAPELGRYFVARGWQVVFPQRRGRGTSDGLYDEGFEQDRSRYACHVALSRAGLDRALEDVDVVMTHLRSRPDVDNSRILLGGISRGGILSVEYAGQRPGMFRGVINFVGGWLGDRCNASQEVKPQAFRRGGTAGVPMLWLYGDRDPFYTLAHSRNNFSAFEQAGGMGRFVAYPAPTPLGNTGHDIYQYPLLWREDLNDYLRQLGLQ